MCYPSFSPRKPSAVGPAWMEWLYLKVFHRGYNMTVPTTIQHQIKAGTYNSTPVLQPEPSTCYQSPNLPLGPEWAWAEMEEQRNEIHCHLRNLRGEDPALVSLLPSAKMCKQSKRKTKVQSSVVPSPVPFPSTVLWVKSLEASLAFYCLVGCWT